MELIRGMHNVRPAHRGCVATIGNFDGVHRGHQAILQSLKARAQEWGCKTALITFEPQPREFFQGQEVPARLTRLREKWARLKALGIDLLVLLPFNEALANSDPEVWARSVFVDGLAVRHVLVGDDFRFGHQRRGDGALLRALGVEAGFTVAATPTVREGGERISSSRIRACLAEADFAAAEQLLGAPYSITGRVVYGRQLGRTLSMPTANLRLQRYRSPLSGVFTVVGEGLDRPYGGVCNIGVRPTVEGREPLLEVHLFDFEGSLYGKLLTVRFLEKIRDEQRFDGLEALQAQIHRDAAAARARWAKESAP